MNNCGPWATLPLLNLGFECYYSMIWNFPHLRSFCNKWFQSYNLAFPLTPINSILHGEVDLDLPCQKRILASFVLVLSKINRISKFKHSISVAFLPFITKPNWSSEKVLNLSRRLKIRVMKMFSKNFENEDVKAIGW